MNLKKLLFLYAFLLFSIASYPQTAPANLKDITASIDTFRNKAGYEKLYVQTDKPYYVLGDTIWLKAYLLDGTLLTPSSKTGIIYIELANDTNAVLLRRMMPVASGLGAGNIVIPAKDFPEGSYLLRAYSNLMRNYGEELVFKRSVYISSATSQTWLIHAKNAVSVKDGKQNVEVQMTLNTPDKKAVGLKVLQVKVMNGRRTIMNRKEQTTADGKADIEFELAEGTRSGQLYMSLADEEKKNSMPVRIPLLISRPENIDLQFMPEGGYMIGDIVSRIAFKAVGEDGKGVDLSGRIYAEGSTESVAEFKALHKGMGSFFMVPKAGKSYLAKVLLPGGTEKTYPLPAVKASGTSLAIRDPAGSDSLQVVVVLPAGQQNTYYLIGQSGSGVAFAAPVRSSARIIISKKLFLTGIARFTLLNSSREPQNERIAYVDHKDRLNIKINPLKDSYGARDSVVLELEVRNNDNQPVSGNFSLAVTDDEQIKIDPETGDIRTNVMLSSYLKGDIEDPRFYFNGSDTGEAIDNLLLTQGWVAYTGNDVKEKSAFAENAALWQKIMNPDPEKLFPAEHMFTVTGRVTNVFKNAVGETPIMMLATKPSYFRQLETDKDGRFIFSEFPEKDSLILKFQATNKKGKLAPMNITIDKFEPPVFKTLSKQVVPWYMNSEATMLNYLNVAAEQKKDDLLSGNPDMLKEVTIVAKKIIKGSHNKNGPGNADIILDEEYMKKAENKTLAQLLESRFPNFRKFVIPLTNPQEFLYKLGERNIRFSIDGIPDSEPPVPNLPSDLSQQKNYIIDDYMDYITADEVLGIEIMSSIGYGTKYDPDFGKKLLGSRDTGPPEVWLEITTRSGNGAFAKATMGTALYRPMPFVGSKQFYTPKYSSASTKTFKDLRSTIHWQPEVITDSQGKAIISFFSADRKGTYSVIAEGSDMGGHVGSGTGSVIIK